MIPTAPTAALTSAGNNWEAYYEYAFNCMLTGEEIKTDWSEGLAGNGVLIYPPERGDRWPKAPLSTWTMSSPL